MYTLKELQKEIERAAQNGDDLGYDVSFADDLLYVEYIHELKEMLDDASSNELDELSSYATNKLFDMLQQTFGQRYI